MKKTIVVLVVVLASVVFAEAHYPDFNPAIRTKYAWVFKEAVHYAGNCIYVIDPSTMNPKGYLFMNAVALRFNAKQLKQMCNDCKDKAINSETNTQMNNYIDELDKGMFKKALDNIEKEKKEVDKRFPGEWDDMESLLLQASGTGGRWIKFDELLRDYVNDDEFDEFKNKLKNGYKLKHNE